MFMGVCVCRCVCVNIILERAYLCMHACSSVRMPLLRVCVCVRSCKNQCPNKAFLQFVQFYNMKTKVKITRMRC